MIFYLGTHMVGQAWWDLRIPLFVSRNRLQGRNGKPRKAYPQARWPWVLDSGAFTEIHRHGTWTVSPRRYAEEVLLYAREVGLLAWCAPQDWMCEPFMLRKTGLTVTAHQERTVHNFLELRQYLGNLVIPVLQGWTVDDYLRCWEMYEAQGVRLEGEILVGLGTVCKRQKDPEAEEIVRSLSPLRLHYFGAKMTGLARFSDALTSADSMAWSYDGRRLKTPCPHGNLNCANCMGHALAWRDRLLGLLDKEEQVT